VEIARGENAVASAPPARETAAAPAANARPPLKVVFRVPNSGNNASAAAGEPNADAQLEEWFSHEFGGNANA
jgi:hypothetical protein